MKTLFLDFDGVLHPDCVLLTADHTEPFMAPPRGHQFPNAELFMWVAILESIITESGAEVQIILSTTWAARWGLERAASYLPASLRGMVAGCTWSEPMVHWRYTRGGLSRSEQINTYLCERREITDWFAIDDEWVFDLLRAKMEPRWIQTHPNLGLSDPAVQLKLREALRA